MRLPYFQFHIERQLRDLLMAHATALVAGTLDRNRLLEQYDDVARDQVEGMLILAERIHHALPEVTPSERFVMQLGRDLSEAAMPDAVSWWGQIRRLPPRTQIAAGIGGATLAAGVVIIASRSMPTARELWRNRRSISA